MNVNNSSTLATSCEELTHWKRLWCWEGLGARGEGKDRGWDGWMASLTRWTWVWVNSESWWWTGRPGVLRFMGLQRVGHDWATELNWIMQEKEYILNIKGPLHPPDLFFFFFLRRSLLATIHVLSKMCVCCSFIKTKFYWNYLYAVPQAHTSIFTSGVSLSWILYLFSLFSFLIILPYLTPKKPLFMFILSFVKRLLFTF